MANFWKLWVRVPALALTAAGIGLGATGALDWAPALAMAAVAAVIARLAGTFATLHRAEEDDDGAAILEFRGRSSGGNRYDRAA